jgi:hypothetical protein
VEQALERADELDVELRGLLEQSRASGVNVWVVAQPAARLDSKTASSA